MSRRRRTWTASTRTCDMNTGIFPSQEPATRWRFRRQTFASSGNWNRPAGVRDVRIEISGGGGSGAASVPGMCNCPPSVNYVGGRGGSAAVIIPNVPSRVTVTVGAANGTSSFGSLVTCTGGSNASAGGNGGNGGVTLSGNVVSEGSVSWLQNGAYAPGGSAQPWGSGALGSGSGAQGVVIVEWMEPVL